MLTRIATVTFPLLALAVCSSPAPQEQEGAAASDAPNASRQVFRSSDLYARGYTDADFPRVEQLAEGVYVYQGVMANSGTRFTINNLFVVTSDGVLLADAQGSPEATNKLVDEIAKVTDQPITRLVIGSDHVTHTGGNSMLPAGIEVLAHPSSAAILQARAEERSCVMWTPYHGGQALCPEDTPAKYLVATEIVRERKVLQLGDREIQVLFLGRARSGGDLFVYLPQEKILYTTQAFLPGFFPAFGTGLPTEWLEVIDRMQEMDVDIYVPGHGFIEAPEILKEELESQEQAMRTVMAEVKELHAAGVPVEQAVAEARFGDVDGRTLRGSQAPTAIRRIYMELNGELPPPVR